jgi:tetratricopeptide (TPR) repeat protein
MDQLSSLGGTRRELGDLDGALGDFAQTIRLNPAFAGAYVGRGLTWRARGLIDRAIAEYDQAIRRFCSAEDSLASIIGLLDHVPGQQQVHLRPGCGGFFIPIAAQPIRQGAHQCSTDRRIVRRFDTAVEMLLCQRPCN